MEHQTSQIFTYELQGLKQILNNNNFLNSFIIYTETSISDIYKQIHNNNFIFPTEYKFVILYKSNKYFMITQLYKYFYILKNYIYNSIYKNKKIYITKFEQIINLPEFNTLKNKQIYTYVKYNDKPFNKYKFFDIDYSLIYISCKNKIMRNPSIQHILDDMINCDDYDICHQPFIYKKNINSIYNNHTIFYSLNKDIINNLKNEKEHNIKIDNTIIYKNIDNINLDIHNKYLSIIPYNNTLYKLHIIDKFKI